MNNITQSEYTIQDEKYSCSVIEINHPSPMTFAVSTLCNRISQLVGLLSKKRRQKARN